MAKIAFVVGEDFEDSEFRVPYDVLKAAGHQIEVLGSKAGEMVRGKRGKEAVKIDAAAGERDAATYDALVIPGGYGPDHLRVDPKVVAFVKAFAQTNRPLAAVCHGPQLLIEADAVSDKKLTSWPSVRKDLENAGAEWVDQEVVVDGSLITSRKPDDLPMFSATIKTALEKTKSNAPRARA